MLARQTVLIYLHANSLIIGMTINGTVLGAGHIVRVMTI